MTFSRGDRTAVGPTRPRWWVRWVAAGLVVALGAVGAVVHRAYLAAPVGTPAEFLAAPRSAARPVVVVAGASTVRGTLSADWVGLLRERYDQRFAVVNAGVNGDATTDLLARADRDLAAVAPDRLVLLVGTNDVRAGVPPERSRAALTAVLDRVGSAVGADVALVSLPPLGEDLDSELNARVAQFNAMLADLVGRWLERG